jgi:hypothetical protein
LAKEIKNKKNVSPEQVLFVSYQCRMGSRTEGSWRANDDSLVTNIPRVRAQASLFHSTAPAFVQKGDAIPNLDVLVETQDLEECQSRTGSFCFLSM